ncbi:MAG: hypothetical protein NT052_00280 [Candidatus Shapirobacteria bacterium]|nr:hypothetical protein [Candidatus Shapirobacteria bacterium]
MNSTKNFLKKYWLFILLSLIASFLIVFYFINKINGIKIKSDLLSIPQPTFDFYNIKTSIDFSSLEKNLQNLKKEEIVYEVKDPSLSDQEAILIAQKFNLTDQPKVYNDQRTNNIFYEWSTEEKYLSINLSTREITYQLNQLKLKTNKNNSIPDLLDTEETAKKFLSNNQFYPPEGVSLITKDKYYLQIGEVEFERLNSPEKANAVEVDFIYQIENKELLEAKISLIMDLDKNIIKLDYQPSFKEIKKISNYPLKTSQEILKKLKSINFINYFNIPNYYTTTSEIENITGINLDKINLTYIKSQAFQSYLQPIFFITGTANLNDGRTAEVGIYLPAVKDEYLLQ